MRSILIVCSANKTRSPLAAAAANYVARRDGRAYRFDSAGIAVIGGQIDENVTAVLEEMGITASHSPTHIASLDIDNYDSIHVMTSRHKQALIAYYKGKAIEDRLLVLGVDDPSGGGLDEYRGCRDRFIQFYEEYMK